MGCSSFVLFLGGLGYSFITLSVWLGFSWGVGMRGMGPELLCNYLIVLGISMYTISVIYWFFTVYSKTCQASLSLISFNPHRPPRRLIVLLFPILGWDVGSPGVGDGQGGLACCSPWGCKESDMTEQLDWLSPYSQIDKRPSQPSTFLKS